LAAALILLLSPSRGEALQPSAPDGFRIGLTVGGISFVGLSMEYRWQGRGVDITVGTWALRDVSVSVVGKQYLGPGGLRPYFGIGLWGVAAFPEDGAGSVLVVRAPVGVDWRVVDENYLGAAMTINRGIWVKRSDPDDQTPLNRRLVPLPVFYHRWWP
jgi:hypothetical protein